MIQYNSQGWQIHAQAILPTCNSTWPDGILCTFVLMWDSAGISDSEDSWAYAMNVIMKHHTACNQPANMFKEDSDILYMV